MTELVKILDKFAGKKIIVVGDVMLDQYSFSEVQRISPEAPVPVLKNIDEKFVLGGAANVANNLVAMGATVELFSVVGPDSHGQNLLNLLKAVSIHCDGILISNNKITTVKHRFVAGNQQLFRVDQEDCKNLFSDEENELLNKIKNKMAWADGVVLSDYAKGLFSEKFVKTIIDFAKENQKPVIVDTKPKNINYFLGVDYVTPNFKEAVEMVGDGSDIEVGLRLVKKMNSNVLLTMGSKGMLVVDKENKTQYVPANKIKVYDVSGAGDTVVAAAFLALLSGATLFEAAKIANLAAEIVVQKSGTAIVSADEMAILLGGGGRHISGVEIVPKLWGYEKWLENNDKYCSKILVLNEGYQCSLHYHKNKDETFLILKGKVQMEVGSEVLVMSAGNFVRILPGTQHRFTGLEDSEILEVSTHHEESDSYRIEESRKVIKK